MHSYRSKPLVEYAERYLHVARAIAQRVSEKVPAVQVQEYKGTFSILQTTTTQTAAKIVLWDPEDWEPGDAMPFMREGVYIWVRASDSLGDASWGVRYPLSSLGWFGRCGDR